ncbi:hypothetical protein [uncultured Nevskia sp.]|uniref:hypothetical protein n=1 Tax=uncultured Nevskia sp. TaxID=228950 RepID=UPI0025D8E36D|nr:hypothetical protein [uncultured Nevskia sp.]
MTSEYMLYRARPQFGAFNTWQNPHFEPLGTVEVLAVAIRNLFATPLRWSRYDEGGWVFAEGKDDGHTIDLMFRAATHGAVDYLVIREGDGPTIVKLVEWLDLNFVFDPVRNKYLDPYHCDEAGQPLIAKGLYELTAERRLVS